ncbi:glycosyltransferase [Sphingomonas sp. NCPPB 2930]
MILLYHKVAPTAPTQWWVTADAFDRQLADLAGYEVVHLDAYDSGNPRHVAITFDGVYENVYQFAFPLLKKWGYPFELFVTGDYIGGDNAFDAVEPPARFCTLEQLDAMAQHGGRVQWHTASHCRLADLAPDALRAEITVPDALKARFPAPHFGWFAYPHGNHDAEAVALVKSHFAGALSCIEGNDSDRYQLNRVTAVEASRFARKRVSVIVANHNYGAFLPQAMDSVLHQTLAPDEIILIDDASTDGSQEIAQRYRDVATVVLNERNLGIVANFNKAVGLCTGDYIAFLGADNRMRCDYVELCRTALDRRPDAAVAYTDMLLFGHRAAELAAKVGAERIGSSKLERWPVYVWRFPEPTPDALANLATRNFMHGSSMYRKDAFDAVGGYQASGGPEDHNLFVRMLGRGWKSVRVPAVLIEYRQHSVGQANTLLVMQLELARLSRIEHTLAEERAQLLRVQEQLQTAQEHAAWLRQQTEALHVHADALRQHADALLAQSESRHRRLEAVQEQNALLDNALIEANARVWTLNHERGEMREQLAEAARREQILHDDNAAIRRENAAVRDENAAVRERIQAVEAQSAAWEQQVQELTRRHQEAVDDIRALVSSRSWKITRPIRFFGLLARGEYGEAKRLSRAVLSRAMRRLPHPMRGFLTRLRARVIAASGLVGTTSVRLDAVAQLVERRNAYTAETALAADVLRPPQPAAWPDVDISVVTHNNGKWIDGFMASLRLLDYPRERLHLRFVDNQSTDQTVAQLQAAVRGLVAEGFDTQLLQCPNNGFGAGHNAGLAAGRSPFGLVSNIDLEFEPDALKRIVAIALHDERGASWELRQKPYEHPKFYDPVTGATNWNSHACVLLRRSAFQSIGGYDDNIFMYGEDVEMSYRLRRAGWVLRYCPTAVVTHYAYENAGQVKPVQYLGSTFANLYLRLKYGKPADVTIVPLMALGLLALPQAFPGSRKALLRNFAKLVVKAPLALAARRSSKAVFPFQVWDYELRRDGAFVEGHPLPADPPLVSVVTRTFQGRERLLRQAMLSVAHQTYPRIELIVVQDGGDSLGAVVREVAAVTGMDCRFIATPKEGRSATGNAGLAAARGRWCLFLDDDDLVFADHVEVLAHALLQQPETVAAYSPAWEVETDFPNGISADYEEKLYTVPPVLKQEFHLELLQERNYMAIQSVLFERRLFEERGGFDVDMDALEDWVMWNVYADGNVFAYVPKVTSLFRTPANVEIRKRRNDIFAGTYLPAKERMAQRIAALRPAIELAA